MQREIYVYKTILNGWQGITKENAQKMIAEGRVFGVELTSRNDESCKITLLKDKSFYVGRSDVDAQLLVDEYFKYVDEITGSVVW